MSQIVLETDCVVKRFGAKAALNNFSLAVERGGIHAVVGSNGAGKSTLFRLLLGVVGADSGTALLLGEDSRHLTPAVRGRVGYVNEEHTLPGWMSARHVTEFQKSFYPEWDQQIYDFVIGHFDVDPSQRVSELSRGERAGLNLAIAFAQRPEILILDEPTLGLDVVAKQSFLEAVMFTDTKENTTIIYCSHQMDEIERVADKLIIMERGGLVNNSSPDDFVDRISYWITEFSGEVPAKETIPGILSSRTSDQQQHIVVVDQGDEFEQFLKNAGAVVMSRSSVSLSRAVNAFLTKNHSTPDYQT